MVKKTKDYDELFEALIKYSEVDEKKIRDRQSLIEEFNKLKNKAGNPIGSESKLIDRMTQTYGYRSLVEDNVGQLSDVKRSNVRDSRQKVTTRTQRKAPVIKVKKPSKKEILAIRRANKEKIIVPRKYTEKNISVYNFTTKKWITKKSRFYTYEVKKKNKKATRRS